MPTNMTRQGNNLPNGNFNPAIWSKKLNVKYYAQTCLMNITNSTWEGEIKGQGSQVEIRIIPTVQINDYTVNGGIQYQDITDEKITLLIDKAKVFAFKVDDIDAAQQDIKVLNQLTTDAGYQMKIHIEKAIFAAVYGDAGNVLASVALDKTNVLDWIVDQEVALEEKNIPSDGRFLVIPPKIAGLIQKSDLKNASITGDSKSVIRSNLNNGRLGEIGGLTLYVSNNIATSGSTYHVMAGHKSAITYASQIVKVENLRLQDTFGDAVRGLNVYGFKVVNADGLVYAPATIAS